LAPRSSGYLDTLAAALVDTGDCPGGLAQQERAVELLPDKLPEDRRRIFTGNLEKLRARCDERTGNATAGPALPSLAR
jgi:hypothetical protein